ncbi:MAG: hypothetical protein ACI8P9_001101 [Parasphingorhabdus sp.]|jgi:hypothetical protein
MMKETWNSFPWFFQDKPVMSQITSRLFMISIQQSQATVFRHRRVLMNGTHPM